MARRIGIIAEYNPFHGGHAYQISEVKHKYPDADIVVFMSGDFVQRGEPAIVSKYFRAKEAVKGGADIVLSPPVFASVSSAGDFAFYGVTGLLAAGCDSISFGCEDIDVAEAGRDIKRLTDIEGSDEYNDVIRSGMKAGLSYPMARFEAVRGTGFFADDLLEKIKKPNNLLAFEYIRALCLLGREDEIELIPVKREGLGYHDDLAFEAEYPSAEGIRKCMREGEMTDKAPGLAGYLGDHNPVFPDDLSQMLFYRLISMGTDEIAEARDCDEDIANRIKNLLPQFESFTQFTELVKTKDVTYTRVSRGLVNILLGIGNVPKELPYMYVLACGKEKRYILSDITSTSDIPILVTGKDEDVLLKTGEQDAVRACLKTDRTAHETESYLSVKGGGKRLPEMFRDYIFV